MDCFHSSPLITVTNSFKSHSFIISSPFPFSGNTSPYPTDPHPFSSGIVLPRPRAFHPLLHHSFFPSTVPVFASKVSVVTGNVRVLLMGMSFDQWRLHLLREVFSWRRSTSSARQTLEYIVHLRQLPKSPNPCGASISHPFVGALFVPTHRGRYT